MLLHPGDISRGVGTPRRGADPSLGGSSWHAPVQVLKFLLDGPQPTVGEDRRLWGRTVARSSSVVDALQASSG